MISFWTENLRRRRNLRLCCCLSAVQWFLRLLWMASRKDLPVAADAALNDDGDFLLQNTAASSQKVKLPKCKRVIEAKARQRRPGPFLCLRWQGAAHRSVRQARRTAVWCVSGSRPSSCRLLSLHTLTSQGCNEARFPLSP